MQQEITLKYKNKDQFDVLVDGKEVAWCQWAASYELWRVLMVSDGHLHHLRDTDEIYRVISDEMGVDIE